MSGLDELRDHPCHAAAEAALAELERHAHGQPIEARACDDGSIALEMWGADWRVLLSLEADPAESGWHRVRINPASLESGGLDDIARLGPLIWSCLEAQAPESTEGNDHGGST